jgi:hypothetical protein
MLKHLLFILFILFVGSVHAQDPQTNKPTVYYPLLDEFIKEGYDRNYRSHTRNLRRIDYVLFQDITQVRFADFTFNSFGTTSTYMVYRYYHSGYNEYRFTIAYNKIWENNYIVLRRLFYKSMGHTFGLTECHKKCDHIMSGRPLVDSHLFFFDAVPEHWEEQLDHFFREISKK